MNTRREREVAIGEIMDELDLKGKPIGKAELASIRKGLEERKLLPMSDAALRTFLREMQGGGLISPDQKFAADDTKTASKEKTTKKSTSGSSTNGKSEE